MLTRTFAISVTLLSLSACAVDDPDQTELAVEDPFLDFGIRDLDGQPWVVISDRQTGGEIIAAPLHGEVLGIDSLRIHGLAQAEIELLPEAGRAEFVDRLDLPVAEQAAGLWQRIHADPGPLPQWLLAVAVLSELYMYLRQFLPRGGGAAEEWPTDGCTFAPDLDFKDCCDAHDVCYCKGGDEAARDACDLALRDCIAAKPGRWHKIIADIYYEAVQALGGLSFNYH